MNSRIQRIQQSTSGFSKILADSADSASFTNLFSYYGFSGFRDSASFTNLFSYYGFSGFRDSAFLTSERNHGITDSAFLLHFAKGYFGITDSGNQEALHFFSTESERAESRNQHALRFSGQNAERTANSDLKVSTGHDQTCRRFYPSCSSTRHRSIH